MYRISSNLFKSNATGITHDSHRGWRLQLYGVTLEVKYHPSSNGGRHRKPAGTNGLSRLRAPASCDAVRYHATNLFVSPRVVLCLPKQVCLSSPPTLMDSTAASSFKSRTPTTWTALARPSGHLALPMARWRWSSTAKKHCSPPARYR